MQSIQQDQSKVQINDVQINEGKFFNLADVKQLDLKKIWLGSTEKALKQFDESYDKFKVEKDKMNKHLKNFQQSEKSYVLNSLLKVNISIDKKILYKQYLKKSRKTIQKLHPRIILNICSYVSQNVFLSLSKIRRVSSIFNCIYSNKEVCQFIGYQYLRLKPQQQNFNYQASLQKYCFRYCNFYKTMKYYKQIFYTSDLPQNTFIQDLSQAVTFINDIHHLVYVKKSKNIQYFQIINKIMKKDRIIMGLAALSLTSLVLTRKASIIAFSNYLALNPSQRSKQQITKTKYLKIIEVAEDQLYKNTLIINTKVSMFLKQYHEMNLAIFINLNHKIQDEIIYSNFWDIVIFHRYDQLKSKVFKTVQFVLDEYISFPKQIQLGFIQLYFEDGINKCKLSINKGQYWENIQLEGNCHITIQQYDEFGYCYLYQGGQYYLMMIANNYQE